MCLSLTCNVLGKGNRKKEREEEIKKDIERSRTDMDDYRENLQKSKILPQRSVIPATTNIK